MRHVQLLAIGTMNVLVGLLWPAFGYAAGGPVTAGKPLSYWVKQLDEGGPGERHIAALNIAELGAKAVPAVPALAKALQNEKVDDIRRTLALTLRRIGPCESAKEAVPPLIHMLGDKNFRIRHAAADTLADLGPHTKAAIVPLIACLKHPDKEFRGKCAVALGATGQADDSVLRALAGALADRRNTGVVEGLFRLGKAGVPLLIDHALASLTTKNKLQFDPDVALALDRLAKIGPDASEAVPGLIKLLGHARGDYRERAATALGAIGPAAKAALPTLERMRREDGQAGQAAADAIKKIERPM